MKEYPKEALDSQNLAECIDEHGRKISAISELVLNDEAFGVYALSIRIDELEKQLKAMRGKPKRLSTWLAKLGL